MQHLDIPLSGELLHFVEAQVASGRFSSVTEYILSLIRDDEKQQGQEQLEALLLEGIHSGPPTEMTSQDWEDLRREAARQLEERRTRKTA